MTILSLIKALDRRLFEMPRYRRNFGGFGKGTYIVNPMAIDGMEDIYLGDDVYIANGVWLASVPMNGDNKSSLEIRSGCRIGNFNHIYCTNKIIIEDSVLTADKVYIADNAHTYQDITIPVLKQPIKQLKSITIGQGAWLGENVCVIGANIGKGSVIGANSVVLSDIDDYCLAVGSPARVVKKFNHNTQQWEKVF